MSFYGSKEWANDILRAGIRELRNRDRARSGRIVEALAYVDLLVDWGWWWQARILQAWIHRFQRGDFG